MIVFQSHPNFLSSFPPVDGDDSNNHAVLLDNKKKTNDQHGDAEDQPHQHGTSKNKHLEIQTTSAEDNFFKRVVIEKSPLHRNENDEKTTIALDVAGYSTDQLDIQFEENVLTVAGERTNKVGDVFAFQRRFSLKADIYDEDRISARLDDTVLEVTVFKKPKPQPRKIPIVVQNALPIQDATAKKNHSEEQTKPAPASVESKKIDNKKDDAVVKAANEAKAASASGSEWEEVTET